MAIVRMLVRCTPPLIAMVCFTATSSASTMLALELEELARRAEEVVVATVVSSQAEPVRGSIVTRYLVRVERTVAGLTTSHDEIEVVGAGGELDGIGLLVHGAARLRTNQHYLLFLRRDGHEFNVVGQAQGVLPIRSTSGTRLIVDPPENLPHLVRLDQGQLVSSTAAITQSTPLSLVVARIMEARSGL